MGYRAGDAYVKEFTTASPTTGASANADSPPVATANHNGTDDGAFALTVTNIDTGRYKITGTVPAGYTNAIDVVNVTVAATVGGIAGKALVDAQTIERIATANVTQVNGGPVGTLPAVIVTGSVSAVTSTSSFTVTWDSTFDGNAASLSFGDLWLSFTSGLNHARSRLITGATDPVTATAALTFTTAFAQTVSVNDKVALISN